MTLGETYAGLVSWVIDFAPRLIAALVTFGATLVLSALVSRWVNKVGKTRVDSADTLNLLQRVARWTVIVLGTVAALDQVNFDVTGFIAGLGVAGLTIGFALQDVARNFIAGVLILLRQPFSTGDPVKVAGYSGTVLDVSSRDTVIKTWDGEMVILPNTEILNSPIINYAGFSNRRRTVRIGLGYGQDADEARRVFVEAIQTVEGVLADPAPTIHAEQLGDSSLTLAARFWVNQQTHSLFDVHSSVVVAITEAADSAGIELPYPIQTVRLEKGDA